MRILVDMDSIVVDLLPAWVNAYNDKYNDNFTVEQITTWDWHELVRPECGFDLYKIVEQPGFLRNLPSIPGALSGVAGLVEQGHEVLLCTAAMSAENTKDKVEWVEEHFGFLGWRSKNMIIANKKSWVEADALIDDSPRNLAEWRRDRPNSIAVAIRYPYNDSPEIEGVNYIGNYKSPAIAWCEMVDFFEEKTYNIKQ